MGDDVSVIHAMTSTTEFMNMAVDEDSDTTEYKVI